LEALGASIFIERGQFETLRSLLARKIPPIVFVSTQDLSYWDEATQHAVVIAGIDETHVSLHDPAFPDAPKTIPIDEFMLAWLEMDEFYALIQLT
jgi:predicted double-glycine peptidase